MRRRTFPKFPLDVIAGFGLGLVIVGAAAAFTLSPLGENFRLWWQARDWPAARCQVVRPLMHEEGLLYHYEYNGRRFQGSRIDIDDRGELRASLRATAAGVELDCWVDPRNPARVLLSKSYDGWWWVPGAWGVGAFLSLAALRGFGDIWRWLIFKPDPPLTWAEWLRSFYQGHAWGPTLIGLCGLVPGLLAVKLMTFDPYWNWRRAQQWEETPCTVVEGEIRWHGGGKYGRSWQAMHLAFEYFRGGNRYVSHTHSPWRVSHTEWLIDPPREVKNGKNIERTQDLALGTRHTCYVSPDNPQEAFFSRVWWEGAYLTAAIGPALCLVGLLALAARPRYD